MGFNVNDLKKSKFLTQRDVNQPMLVIIESYEEVDVAREGAEPEMRWALNFQGIDKPMILNSTNGQIIAAIAGSDDSDDWIGKEVVVYQDPNIFFGGKRVGGIRVRAPKKKTTNPQQKTETEDDIPF